MPRTCARHWSAGCDSPPRPSRPASWVWTRLTGGASTWAGSPVRPDGHDGPMTSPGLLITSLANPRVKQAVALRDRRERDATGLTLVDGVREARRALEAGIEVAEAFLC